MPTYRASFIDKDVCVTSYRPVEAATDEEALQIARQFVDCDDVEVWYFDRKVGRLEHIAAAPTNIARLDRGD
jgi:hypothetical protein